jgi:hypothetical protein
MNLRNTSSFSKKDLMKSALTRCKTVVPTTLALVVLRVSLNKAISPNESPG